MTATTPTTGTGTLRCEFEVEFAPGPHEGCAEFTPEPTGAAFRCAYPAVAALETREEYQWGIERQVEHFCAEHAALVAHQAEELEWVTLLGRTPLTPA